MKYAITLAFLLVSLYVTVAGYQAAKTLQQDSVRTKTSQKERTYEYSGIVFRDEESLLDFVREQQAIRWFGWIFSLPANLILLAGCIAAGLFGGAVHVLIQLARKHASVSYNDVLVHPVIGASIGVLLFFFSLALPIIFSSGPGPVRPETALVFAMSGGLFSEQAYMWLQTQVSRVVFQQERADKPNNN